MAAQVTQSGRRRVRDSTTDAGPQARPLNKQVTQADRVRTRDISYAAYAPASRATGGCRACDASRRVCALAPWLQRRMVSMSQPVPEAR